MSDCPSPTSGQRPAGSTPDPQPHLTAADVVGPPSPADVGSDHHRRAVADPVPWNTVRVVTPCCVVTNTSVRTAVALVIAALVLLWILGLRLGIGDQLLERVGSRSHPRGAPRSRRVRRPPSVAVRAPAAGRRVSGCRR